MIRLDRYVSVAAGLSRSQARRAIGQGRVRVADAAARDPSTRLPEDPADVTLDGALLCYQQYTYLMMNKPADIVCSARDDGYPSVLRLVDAGPSGRRLHVVGRLDADTTGLLLLTNDGDWSHRVTAPAKKLPKVYLVQTANVIGPDVAEAFHSGLLLRSESSPTKPARLRLLAPDRAEVTLCEGRYHQVKRMFAACSLVVVSLHRQRIGGLPLDPRLGPGDSRELTAAEQEAVFQPVPV